MAARNPARTDDGAGAIRECGGGAVSNQSDMEAAGAYAVARRRHGRPRRWQAYSDGQAKAALMDSLAHW